jgi:hypothetical protein
MRPQEPRSFDEGRQPIDIEDADQVRHYADKWSVDPEDIEEAVRHVGGNPTAVEIWLQAPPL